MTLQEMLDADWGPQILLAANGLAENDVNHGLLPRGWPWSDPYKIPEEYLKKLGIEKEKDARHQS